jgi:hypothetical protein
MSDQTKDLVAKDKTVVVSEVEEFEVETNIVREVDEANYNQAERTINALEKADLSTKHALNGLHEGHGYKLESYVVKAPVKIRDKQIGETIYGENHLVSYSLKDGIYQVERKDQILLESGGSQITGPVDPAALAVQSSQLQTTNPTDQKKGKIIEINAISRKVQKQIKSGLGDLVDSDW